jgi:hypothetical protein
MTKNTETKPLICSICQGDIDAQGTWTRGHNAEPINDGRCCTHCNNTVVIPARIVAIYRAERKVS